MKKRLPKKILAAFLAAMMVVTSVPFSAITAFAANGYVDVATDAKVQAVETAMKNFQSVLAEDKSYSNVGPAYAAYVACQQGLDAYIYGGESKLAFFVTKLATRSVQFAVTGVLDVLLVWVLCRSRVFTAAGVWPTAAQPAQKGVSGQ